MSIVQRQTRLYVSHALVVVAAIATVASGCRNNTEFNRSSTPKAKGIITEKGDGIVITHMDTTNNSRIAEVRIPKGALAIDQKVTVASSYHTDPSDLKGEFGIKKGNVLKETKIATVVSSNVDRNLAQPMVIALDLPAPSSGLLSLFWDDRNFFVVYTVRDADLGIWKRGIMPEKELSLKDNRIVFSSQLMGRYEIFESVEPIQPSQSEKTVTKPDFDNPPVAVSAVSPLVAHPGEELTITGKYFTKDATIAIDGTDMPSAKFVSRQQMRVTLPRLSWGEKAVTVFAGDNSAAIDVFVHNKDDNIPMADASEGEVCAGKEFYDKQGDLRTGSKNCGKPACTGGNQQDCTATSEFPALNSKTIPWSQVLPSQTIFGTNGQAPAIPSTWTPCSAEGQANCRVTGGFIALKKGVLNNLVVKSGTTIPKAGPGGQEIKGEYPSANAPLPDAQSDGSYSFLYDTNIVTAVKSDNVTFQFWDSAGQRHTYTTDGSLKADAIKQGITIYGTVGAIPGGKRACKKSGMDDCYAGAPYVAVPSAKFHKDNFKNGYEIGTVTGTYPSADNKLPVPAKFANHTAISQGTFEGALRQGKPLVFFDSAGELHVGPSSASLKPENIVSGVSIFGVSGTMELGRNLKATDLRASAMIGGSTWGQMKYNCRNMGSSKDTTFADGAMIGGTPWGLKAACTESSWRVVSSGCTEGQCVLQDLTTKQMWWADSTPRTLQAAKDHCTAMTRQGSSKWRVPSIGELYQAYAHGIYLAAHRHQRQLTNKLNKIWSTSAAKDPSNVMVASLKTGESDAELNDKSFTTVCVTDSQ